MQPGRDHRTGARGPGRRRRGSVLVPVVAAMLLLSLTGIALAELFAAQRHQAVLLVESSRAHWIAEAGLRHAARKQGSILSPVAFAGGSYTVDKTGVRYVSTGIAAGATRSVELDFVPTDPGGSPPSPLDEGASAGVVTQVGNDKFELELVSSSANAAILSSFSLSADQPTRNVDKLKLDGGDIWKLGGGVPLPTPLVELNEGDLHERTVLAGDAPALRVEFKGKPAGTLTYTLVLVFTNGASSTLVFSIAW